MARVAAALDSKEREELRLRTETSARGESAAGLCPGNRLHGAAIELRDRLLRSPRRRQRHFNLCLLIDDDLLSQAAKARIPAMEEFRSSHLDRGTMMREQVRDHALE